MTTILEHPAFPQPSDVSLSVWRYMDFDKFEWLVEKQRLFMPSADRLGDPWEGKTPQGYINWWDNAIAAATSAELRDTITHNRDFVYRISQQFRDRYYVTCWHMNEHENYAMWGCYTNTEESVAIKSTYLQFVDALPNYAYTGMVRYLDYASDQLPPMNLFQYIMHKDSFFSYEQEARGVVLPVPHDPIIMEDFAKNHFELASVPGFRVFAPPIDVAKLINAVVLHPKSSTAFQARVAELCSKHSLPSPDLSRQTKPYAK